MDSRANGVKHAHPITARGWKDFQIPSLGFVTVLTFRAGLHRAEIMGPDRLWLSSGECQSEGQAQTEVVALANKQWPPRETELGWMAAVEGRSGLLPSP